jgi:HSP20 family protein
MRMGDRSRNTDPWRQMEVLQRELERAFGGSQQQPQPSGAFLPGRSARAYPLMNMAEDADHYTIEALAPGVNPESIQITVVRNVLTVAGEKTPPEGVQREQFHRTERAAGRFVRNIELPTDVDPDKVQARYTNGLLVLTLPKAEAAKPRQIKVSVG